MDLRERLLNRAFWTWDRARGGFVRQHLDELRAGFADLDSARNGIRARAEALVDHAVRSTWFYRERAGLEFHELPLVDKGTIKRRWRDFSSSSYDFGGLSWISTSGSSGTPFQVPCTPRKQARRRAEVIYFGGWAGYRVGMRYAYLSAMRPGALARLIQNRVQPDLGLADPESLQRLALRLAHQRVRSLIGYPSFISLLARAVLDGPLHPGGLPLDTVITIGEKVTPLQRQLCKEAFGASLVQRYSLNEVGIVAQECPEEGRLHVNLPGVLVEILDSQGRPTEASGETGRLVVTDPESHPLPLIRYDTGDLGAWGSACLCGRPSPVLERVEGRRVDEISTPEGGRVSPYLITHVFRDIEDVAQYQFAQEGAGIYVMRLVTDPGFDHEDLVHQRLREVLGPKARVRFRYLSAIPPLRSGKRPVIVDERSRSVQTISVPSP